MCLLFADSANLHKLEKLMGAGESGSPSRTRYQSVFVCSEGNTSRMCITQEQNKFFSSQWFKIFSASLDDTR